LKRKRAADALAFFRLRQVYTMQGYYFSAALPREQFLAVLQVGTLATCRT
jgi:sensor c-di-GMP phosphodiesterase-like protein